MAERRALDDTDMEILRLLTEDSRRSFRDIAESVSLSPPAVSDRVDRLQEQGIIRRFTVEIDRSAVHGTTPVVIEIEPVPGAIESILESISTLTGVEQLYRTVEDRFILYAYAPGTDIDSWLWDTLDRSSVSTVSVDLLADVSWYSALEQATFSLTCVLCDNSIGADGITSTFDGEPKAFCCPSCLSLYEERYETHTSNA